MFGIMHCFVHVVLCAPDLDMYGLHQQTAVIIHSTNVACPCMSHPIKQCLCCAACTSLVATLFTFSSHAITCSSHAAHMLSHAAHMQLTCYSHAWRLLYTVVTGRSRLRRHADSCHETNPFVCCIRHFVHLTMQPQSFW